MRRAIEGPDARALQLAAHGLKSASRNLGAIGMGVLCERLEAAGRAGSLDGAAASLDELRGEFERVRDFLSTLR